MSETPKKIVLLGHFGVGKTSLIQRYVHREFSLNYLTTIGVHIEKKIESIGERQVPMIIWDIAGEPTIKKIPAKYLKHAHGLIYVFDLSRPTTFQNMPQQLQELKQIFSDVPMVVVGNKRDLIEPDASIKDIPIEYFETSAKTGENVEKIFKGLAQQIVYELG